MEVQQAEFMQQHSEARLLLLARSGDKEAFGDLMTGARIHYGIGLMGQSGSTISHLRRSAQK